MGRYRYNKRTSHGSPNCRRYSASASQTSIMNRMSTGNSSPTAPISPVRCSTDAPRRISWVCERNHRRCLLKQERHTEQHLSLSEQTSSWSESTSSSGSGSYESKKSERPMLTRPSNLLRYKTELCRSFEESGECRFGVDCTFAHGFSEMRAVHRHPLYKTDLCRTYHSQGYCQYGARCHFVHDPEEAAGVSPMRGFKLRSSTDRLASTLLALAEDAGVATSPSTNDVLLANLRRLDAVRTMEQSHLSDAPSSRSRQGTLGDMVCNNECGMLSAEPSFSKASEAGSCVGSSVYNTSQDLSLEPSMDTSLDTSGDTGLWSTSMSTSSGDSLCNTLINLSCLSPDPEAPIEPLSISSMLRLTMSHEMRRPATGQGFRPFISNPMEVSRSLQLPTIAELCKI